MKISSLLVLLDICALLCLGGCGTYIPQIQEAWEGKDIQGDMEYRIKQHIFCETIDAIRFANKNYTGSGRPRILPDSYGVQMQINLTVEENGALNPSLTYNQTFANATVLGVTVPRMFNFGTNATLASTATRTDSSYSYYNVGKISRTGANQFCSDNTNADDTNGSSPLLKSDLGIRTYLKSAAEQAYLLPSSKPPKTKKDLKLDIYTYEIKFLVVSNGSINPSWRLVNISADTGTLPLLQAGRTRTHDLILTFGPGDPTPAPEAVQSHFTTQLIQALDRARRNDF